MSASGVATPEIHLAMRSEYSDAEIAHRVRTFLTSRHFPAFRALQVDVHNGLVSLKGHVRTFYEKQVALNSCQRVAGVLSLDDQIKVDLDQYPLGPRRADKRPR